MGEVGLKREKGKNLDEYSKKYVCIDDIIFKLIKVLFLKIKYTCKRIYQRHAGLISET